MTERMSFEAALEFLADRTKFGINQGLERIEELLRRLGEPQRGQVKYIHIGGTNGKGSTAAFLADILTAAGYRVGVFTSPHLHSYTERMVIDGRQIPEQRVVDLIERIEPLLTAMEAEGYEPPTEFEVNTAMAYLYFTEEAVDYAIIEVGMGGAIDSTNVITPELAIITNVAMDHMSYLGSTVEEIAAVKAGIIKPGRPVICGSKLPAVRSVIANAAREQGAPLALLNRDFAWMHRLPTAAVQFATFEDVGYQFEFAIRLLGVHQLDNAALAIEAALQLEIEQETIIRAVRSTAWRGRLEIMSRQPLVVIDGAHNVDGMQCLSRAIDEYWQDCHVVAVLGMLADKERRAALAELLPRIDRAVVTRVPSSRAGDWQSLAEVCEQAAVPVETIESVRAACARGLELAAASAEPQLLLVTGSLYMIAEARAYFCELFGTEL